MGHQRTNQPHQLPIFTQGHVHLLIVAIHALTADEVSWPINECLSMLSFCICNNFSADLLLQGHEVHAKHRVLLPQSPTFPAQGARESHPARLAYQLLLLGSAVLQDAEVLILA